MNAITNMTPAKTGQSALELLNYRRAVSDIYTAVRASDLPDEQTWLRWRQSRDRLFRNHPQSALNEDQAQNFTGLRYFDYNPALRLTAHLEPDVQPDVQPDIIPIETDVDGTIRAQRAGRVHLTIDGMDVWLSLFWLLGYGGGLFLPFRDQTNGKETYGGGRYLLDTIKHADLGQTPSGELILDFNYAYNPSCAYNHLWSCPLAPPENRIDLLIRAGEEDSTG